MQQDNMGIPVRGAGKEPHATISKQPANMHLPAQPACINQQRVAELCIFNTLNCPRPSQHQHYCPTSTRTPTWQGSSGLLSATSTSPAIRSGSSVSSRELCRGRAAADTAWALRAAASDARACRKQSQTKKSATWTLAPQARVQPIILELATACRQCHAV
jgi:hypothetical protein